MLALWKHRCLRFRSFRFQTTRIEKNNLWTFPVSDYGGGDFEVKGAVGRHPDPVILRSNGYVFV
jgi:hypothetical protein